MALLDKLESTKCVETVWGKLIPEKEAYKYAVRQIASFCANLFQVMRILEPDFEKRTSAICEISYMMNMSASGEEYMTSGIFRNSAKRTHGLAASSVTPVMSTRIWRAVWSSSPMTVWKRSWIPVHGILWAQSCAI